MIAILFDTRERSSPMNGIRVQTRDELIRTFDSLPKNIPFFCKLQGENGYELLVGVGPTLGCIQHSRSDGEPPYLVAVAGKELDEGAVVDFLFGNEFTPVPTRRCLPYDTVKEVAACFVETGDRSPIVRWEDA